MEEELGHSLQIYISLAANFSFIKKLKAGQIFVS